MTLYKCEQCKYESRDKNNFSKHIESKKHQEKVKQSLNISQSYPIDISNDSHVCVYCNVHFTKSCNLSRHKRTCGERMTMIRGFEEKIDELNKEIDELNKKFLEIKNDHKKEISHVKALHKQELKTSDSKIESLQRENKRLLDIVNGAGSIMKSSISTTNYIIKNFKDAPALAPPEDFSRLTYANYNQDTEHETDSDDDSDSDVDQFKDMRNCFIDNPDDDNLDNDYSMIKDTTRDKEKFVDKLIKYHKKKQLNKYLGDIIIKHYKKKDPSEQSIFNSDTTRLTYIIRELFTNKKIDWTVDKKGIKTTNYIINPFLEHIDELIKEYMQMKTNFDHKTATTHELETNFSNLTACGEIVISIEKKELCDEVLKYIAPFFYYMKDNKNNLLE